MALSEIKRAEKVAIAEEERVAKILSQIRWDVDAYKKEVSPEGGDVVVDGIPIVSVANDGGMDGRQVGIDSWASYKGQNLEIVCGTRIPHPIRRAVDFQKMGLKHFIGISNYGDAGLFAERGFAEHLRFFHSLAVLEEYPEVRVSGEMVANLNISPHFVFQFGTRGEVKYGDKKRWPKLWFDRINHRGGEDGSEYSVRLMAQPRRESLLADVAVLTDWRRGEFYYNPEMMDPQVVDKMAKKIGCQDMEVNSSWVGFKSPKPFKYSDLVEAFQSLGSNFNLWKYRFGTLSFACLTPPLRNLVNVSFEGAKVAKRVRKAIKHDFKTHYSSYDYGIGEY